MLGFLACEMGTENALEGPHISTSGRFSASLGITKIPKMYVPNPNVL